MEEKTKLYGVLLLSLFLTTFFVGYVIGYEKAEKVYGSGWKGCIDVLTECNNGLERCVGLLEGYNATLKECTKQLKEEEVNYKLDLLEKGYDNGWWDANWTKRIKVNETWIYYTENCTHEQISDFVEGDYYKGNYYTYTYYDNFSDCYIWRQN